MQLKSKSTSKFFSISNLSFPSYSRRLGIFCFVGLSMGLFMGLSGCESADSKKGEDIPVSSGSFSGSMQSLKNSLTDLLPLIMDPKQFNEDANQLKIRKEVSNLVKNSKDISHSPMVQNTDPTLRFVSSAFTEDLKRADESLEAGRREYARYVLMNVTSYCIECHTRTDRGPSFQTPEIEKTLVGLRSIDRAEYLVSTRQFERALVEFRSIIGTENLKDLNLFELDRAIRYSLAISVKFLKDPQKSSEIVDQVLKSPSTPFYLKQSARAWQKAINEWKKEKLSSVQKPQASAGANEVLRTSRTLVEKGRLQQNGVGDRSGDVYFLRAISDLHSLMMNSEKLSPGVRGEGLYLLGLSYSSVRDLGVWALHENYFESCIRQQPHTKWSQACYQKFEESVLAGFSGSSGVRVPLDTQQRLGELKKLAL